MIRYGPQIQEAPADTVTLPYLIHEQVENVMCLRVGKFGRLGGSRAYCDWYPLLNDMIVDVLRITDGTFALKVGVSWHAIVQYGSIPNFASMV